MPISGVVITTVANEMATVLEGLAAIPEIEIHGQDEKGHIVAVLETGSSEEMETLVDSISKDVNVLNIGLTYLNMEDEAEKMAKGEPSPRPSGFRQPS